MKHPNIFIFIEALKEIQIETYIKLNSLSDERVKRNKKQEEKNDYLENLISQYSKKKKKKKNQSRRVCQIS